MIDAIDLHFLVFVKPDLKIVRAVKTDTQTERRVVHKHSVESGAIFSDNSSYTMFLSFSLAYLELSSEVDFVPVKTEVFLVVFAPSRLPCQYVCTSNTFSSLFERNFHFFLGRGVKPGMEEHQFIFCSFYELRYSIFIVILVGLVDQIME